MKYHIYSIHSMGGGTSQPPQQPPPDDDDTKPTGPQP